jgi:glycosyltransferase involved in cell wall biosynthesis
MAGRWTDALVSVADAMTDQAVAAGVAGRDKFVTIRSGMEVEAFRRSPADHAAARRQWGFPEDAIVVGTIARLFRDKGYEHLLEALPAIAAGDPRIRFVWVGDGANRGDYEVTLRRLGLRDRVRLAGLVHPREIPGLLNGFDVLAHASLWEGLARALVQASLCEVAVVSFDNDGAPEVVEDGRTGYLVPLGDTATLADRVRRLCADETLRAAMGRQAREHCLRRFDHELMVDQLDALYRRLLA